MQAIFAYLSQTPEGIELRQQGEKQQALEHARERLERAVKGLKDKTASGNEVVRQIYKQITPTLNPGDNGIWSEIDLLEGDPMHRGVAMRNPRHKPIIFEMKRQFLGYVRASFANPVRGGFDHVLYSHTHSFVML